MTRSRIATTLGILVAVSSILVLLAGSDLPPPPGFLLVMPVAIGVGVLVRVVVPQVLATMDRTGLAPALRNAIGAGAIAGFLVGVLFVAIRSGEPSVPQTSLAQSAVFALIVAAVGGCAAATVSLVAILADRAHTTTVKVMTIAVPGLLALVVPGVVIATRFPGA